MNEEEDAFTCNPVRNAAQLVYMWLSLSLSHTHTQTQKQVEKGARKVPTKTTPLSQLVWQLWYSDHEGAQPNIRAPEQLHVENPHDEKCETMKRVSTKDYEVLNSSAKSDCGGNTSGKSAQIM